MYIFIYFTQLVFKLCQKKKRKKKKKKNSQKPTILRGWHHP